MVHISRAAKGGGPFRRKSGCTCCNSLGFSVRGCYLHPDISRSSDAVSLLDRQCSELRPPGPHVRICGSLVPVPALSNQLATANFEGQMSQPTQQWRIQ